MGSNLLTVYDASVLYPPSIRDLFVRLAIADLVQAKWTDQILDEFVNAVIRTRPNAEDSLNRSRQLMEKHLPLAKVTGYKYLIPSLDLPDPNDRHVLAAAIHSSAKVIVTYNLKDFPKDCLDKYDMQAWSPDFFVSTLLKNNIREIVRILRLQAYSLKNPPVTFEILLNQLNKNNLINSVYIIREYTYRKVVRSG